MQTLANINVDLDIFYKKANLPKITIGDTVRVTIYLELPKEVAEGQKKRKRREFKHLKELSFLNTVIVRKSIRQ